MSKKQIVDRSEWLSRLPQLDRNLYAMYSSGPDCITTDQSLMMVPVDDHMVHRGDAVFESFKCLDGHIYNLGDHLKRLERSCEQLGLGLPFSLEEIADVSVQTIRAGGQRNSLVRLLVSRGIGTMGVNPYACIKPELYIIVYELKNDTTAVPSPGVSVALSKIPIKPGMFARVKTCNYLPNVLMKKEAVDQGVDFTVSLDEEGFLGEGATENIGIVTQGNELFMPPLDRVLAGTTARRALKLAQTLKESGALVAAEYHPVTVEMAKTAKEIHIYGTTPNVSSVIQFEGQPVADGKPGPVARQLFDLLKEEMVPDSRRLTTVFED